MTRNASMILTLTDTEILQNELECWGANGAPAWWTWDPEDCGDSSRGQGPKVRLSKLLPSCQVDSVNEIHGVDLMQSDLKVLSISSNRLRNLGSVWSSAGTQIWFKFNVTPTFFKYKLSQGLRMPNTPRGELGSQQARDQRNQGCKQMSTLSFDVCQFLHAHCASTAWNKYSSSAYV